MFKQYLSVLSLILIMSAVLFAQQAEHEGIALYKQGKYSEAARRLEVQLKTSSFKANADLWNYLGLSRLALNDAKSARKALERAVKLAPSDPDFRTNLGFAWLRLGNPNRARQEATRAIGLDANNAIAYFLRGSATLTEGKFDDADRDALRALEIDPKFAQAYLLRSDILLERSNKRALSSTEMGAAVSANTGSMKEARDILRTGAERVAPANRNIIDGKLHAITLFYDYLTNEHPVPGMPKPAAEPGVTPAKILATPKARYTDRARQKNIQGAIRVAILLGASGRVEHVLFLKKLGYGLDENVFAAARSISFEPKQKDGRPVPSVIIREYTFTIY